MGVCGSSHFVKNFTAFLNDTGNQLQVAVVMDTTMNYNTTPNSQKFPAGVQRGLPALYKFVKENNFRETVWPSSGERRMTIICYGASVNTSTPQVRCAKGYSLGQEWDNNSQTVNMVGYIRYPLGEQWEKYQIVNSETVNCI